MMSGFVGTATLSINIEGVDIEGALLRASLATGEILIPKIMLPGDVYWRHVVIRDPYRIDARAIKVSDVPGGSEDQQILEVKWKISRNKIRNLAKSEEESESIYESLGVSKEAREIIVDSNTLINEEVARYLAKNPKHMYDLSPRAFEELVAHVLDRLGLNVELTKASRDGGVDIYAYVKNQVASFLIVVECKKYSPENRVGIDVVQRLFGVQQGISANKSIIVTTSHFTEPAINQCSQYKGQMELKDYENLREWLALSSKRKNVNEGVNA